MVTNPEPIIYKAQVSNTLHSLKITRSGPSKYSRPTLTLSRMQVPPPKSPSSLQ